MVVMTAQIRIITIGKRRNLQGYKDKIMGLRNQRIN